jgi:hypothetical protein
MKSRPIGLSPAFALLALALPALARPPAAAAQYSLQGIGALDGLATEAVAINDAGQVAGTRTGL